MRAEGRKVEKLGAGGLTGLTGLPGLGFYSEKGHRWRIWSRGGGWDLTWAGRVVLAPVLSLTKEKRTEEEVSEKVG